MQPRLNASAQGFQSRKKFFEATGVEDVERELIDVGDRHGCETFGDRGRQTSEALLKLLSQGCAAAFLQSFLPAFFFPSPDGITDELVLGEVEFHSDRHSQEFLFCGG